MLILVRKVQQGIWIEGDIWVRVLSVDRDRVKLGITAPGDVKVMRQELFGDVENPENGVNGFAFKRGSDGDHGSPEEPS
jgi:carbon storage regulator